MSKHTPGPWSRVPQSKGGDLIAQEYETGNQMNPKGLRLIAFMMSRGDSLATDEANARLISIAPEMAEMIRYVAHVHGEPPTPFHWTNRLRALLAKLEGDAP